MPDYLDNDYLLKSLNLDEEEQELIESGAKTSGSAIYDFVGQVLWGAATELTWSGIQARDEFGTYMAGDDYKSWEKAITGYDADWSELSNWQKAGYTTGSVFGMLPSFGLGSLLGRGGVKTAGKIGSIGMKMATRKSAPELIEAAAEVGIKKGTSVVKSLNLTDDAAREILRDGFKIQQATKAALKLEEGAASELLENVMSMNLKKSISQIAKIGDEEAAALSREAIRIITKNSPDDALNLLTMAAQQFPVLNKVIGGERMSRIVGAMGYDAAIGLAMGTQHAVANQAWKSIYGVEKDHHTGEFEYKGDYGFNLGEFAYNWAAEAGTSAWHFALIGPAKFVRGGTQGQHARRLGGVITNMAKYLKPLTKITEANLKNVNNQLRAQLTAINEISGGFLNKTFKGKGYPKHAKWWETGTTMKDTKLMQRYLSDIRRDFIKKAPVAWAKEFGKDALLSLPRMGAGVMAMHAPSLIQSFHNNGFSQESFVNAFGESGPERIANIWTAMWFTRRPHSFHTEATPGMFAKMFNTGTIPHYVNAKASKLRKVMGGLNTYGADNTTLNNLIYQYGDRSNLLKNYNIESSKTISKYFDQTKEFGDVDKIFKDHSNLKNQEGGTDLETAYNRKIVELVEQGKLTTTEADKYYDNLLVTREVLKLYHGNTGKELASDLYSPNQAWEIVNDIAGVQFGGKILSVGNIDSELRDFKEATINKAVLPHTQILRDYIIKTYEKLDIPIEIDPETGNLRIPHVVNAISFQDRDVSTTLATVIERGQQNGWIELLEPPSSKNLKYGSKELGELREIWKNSSDQMMNTVWGEGWKGREQFDPLILENDAWALTHNDFLHMRRRTNAYQVLTGNARDGSKHTLDPGEAGRLEDSINTFIKFKKAPAIEKTNAAGESIDPAVFGKVENFINSLHKSIKMLNPTISDTKPKVMTFKQAESLMEMVSGKEGRGGLLGNLFSDPTESAKFEVYILDKSMDKLGGNDLNVGVDTKASLVTLLTDVGFNYSRDGSNPRLPSLGKIKEKLHAAKIRGKLGEGDDIYNSLLEHYTHIVDAVEISSFPVEFRKDLIEIKSGDWIKSITTSLAKGKYVMDAFSYDKSERMSAHITNEVDRLKMKMKGLREGVNIKDIKIKKKFADELDYLLKVQTEALNLQDIIKTALREKNPYILDAVARRQGEITNALHALRNQPLQTTRGRYAQELLDIVEKIKTAGEQRALNENSVMDRIREEIRSYDISEKDVQDKIIKITNAQFSLKYGIGGRELNGIFAIDRLGEQTKKEIEVFVRGLAGAEYDTSVFNQVRESLLRASTNINFDPNTPEGVVNFRAFVVRPLETVMELKNNSRPSAQQSTQAELFSDLYTVTSNYFSKTGVKTLKIDARSGIETLYQSSTRMGNAKDRGLIAILEALDPNQNFIYLAETSATGVDGRTIRNINTEVMNDLNVRLKSHKFSIVNPKGKVDIYNAGDNTEIHNVNREPGVFGERFEIIPLNESTSLIVRMDFQAGKSIHKEIKSQFREADSSRPGDLGGKLFRMLEAVYDGDFNINTPEHKAIRKLLYKLQSANNDGDVIQAIKLTRMLHNMPGFIDKVLGNNGEIDLQHDLIKDFNKRDKLAETKNGYIPTKENRIRTADMYKNSASILHQRAYRRISEWLEPDAQTGEFKKLKTISFDDEGKIRDTSGNIVTDNAGKELANIFDSLHRHRAQLEVDLVSKRISKPEYDQNIEIYKDAYKSITDGSFFLSENAYLAAMSMIGLHGDMVRVNDVGDIIGFKSGGMKPTIAHAKVNIDKNNPNYGRIEQFFAKTSFQYNPLLNSLMKSLGVDAITFKSANKINTFKSKAGEETIEPFSTIKGLNEGDFKKLDTPWHEFLGQKDNIVSQNIIEIPWESMSLRTISKEHDPLVGQNAGVHMNHNNGIADWIGLDTKISNFSQGMGDQYTNVGFRTALAQKVLGARAEQGDPAIVNSAINSIITRDGLIIEPWAQRTLEDNMIGYFLNNGSIGGGVVPHGSLDIMQADMGDLRAPIRSNLGFIGGDPTKNSVRFYGEFLQSYYASQKGFIKSGVDPNGIHSIIIQEIGYTSQAGKTRTADAFLVDINGEKFLQVEGRYIDKEGHLRDIDSSEILYTNSENKKAYDNAIFAEKSVYDNIQPRANIADVQYILRDMDKTMAVGAINSRQPRNMIGDLVISRLAFNPNGQAYVDINSGNVSRMNFADAIKPQDADFDFDKSFNYNAAPGLFWKETNKLAGHITTGNVSKEIDRLFDPNLNTQFSKSIADMIGKDATYSQIQNEVDAARGRFIKMHQTATYLANIFRQHPEVLTFEMGDVYGKNKLLQVRISDKGKYISTVDNISKMASQFIDIYSKLPSLDAVKEIARRQNEIWFGPDGIFEIGAVDLAGKAHIDVAKGRYESMPDLDLNSPQFRHVIDGINNRLIRPINEYLKYNRGYTMDPSGMEQTARLVDYHTAFKNLYKKSLDPTNPWGIDKTVDMKAGIQAAIDYMSTSRNPYDIAMRSMNEIYMKQSNMKEEGIYGKGKSESQDIIDYIEGGYDRVGLVTDSPANKHNRIFNKALKEYVADESRMLRLIDLSKQQKAIKYQIDDAIKFERKGPEVSQKLKDLTEKMIRVSELKESMEQALSYEFRNNINIPPTTIKPNRSETMNPKGWQNFEDKPVVIVDSKGKIKEVILKGKSNFNPIYSSDKMILNGRRFKTSDGENQKGLRILFEAFAGNAKIKVGDDWVRLKTYESTVYINQIYRELSSGFIKLKETLNERPKNRQDITDYSVGSEQLLYERLFEKMDNPVHQKALILRLLTPSVSDKVISVRSTNKQAGKQAVYDYMYMENPLSKPMMSLLAKLASGERIGDKKLAMDVLEDINYMKNAAFISATNPNVSVELVLSRMGVEPASLEGPMTTQRHLSQEVFAMSQSKNKLHRDAANIMIDYAQGKGLVDPVILYKASVAMSKAGIDYSEQWSRMKMLSKEDGSLVNFGFDRILINEVDALRSRDLGERGGTLESTKSRIDEIFNACP